MCCQWVVVYSSLHIRTTESVFLCSAEKTVRVKSEVNDAANCAKDPAIKYLRQDVINFIF
jgi:hypothetical protein